MSSSSLFQNVFVLTNKEYHAKWDQEALQKLKVPSVRVFNKGVPALNALKEDPPDILLCDGSLDDMDGLAFIQAMRKDQNLKKLPVIMVTTENRMERVLDSISAGCSGYILRPYSFETFQRHMRLAHHMENFMEIEEIQLEEAQSLVDEGQLDDAIEAFEEVVNTQDESRKYYDMGCDYLHQGRYGQAIIAFKKAVKLNGLFAEAYKGLADAYERKGKQEKYKEYLRLAAEVYAQQDNMEETKKVFIEILKMEKRPENPFNTLGVRLRRKGDYQGAVHYYQRALELTPDDENIYYNMARAHFFMNEPKLGEEMVKTALKLNRHFREAQLLYLEITGDEFKPKGAEKERPKRPERSSTLDS